MQVGQGQHRQGGLGGCATGDLIALFGRCHVCQDQDEIGSVTGDLTVMAVGDRDLYVVGHLGVEGVLRAVADGDAVPHGLVLRRQLDRERRRQLGAVAVGDRNPVGGAGLSRADRRGPHRIHLGAKDLRQPSGGHLAGRARDGLGDRARRGHCTVP